jgi:predicted amidophosphoribosyltransferase
MTNHETCCFCGSKLFYEDRVCPNCGAPYAPERSSDRIYFESETIVEGDKKNPCLFVYSHIPKIHMN